MTIYYVDFSRADDTGDGLSWGAAKKTLQAALTLASSGSDVIYWDKDSAETVAADTTLTAAGNVAVISVDKDSANAVTAGASIGGQATNYAITLAGAFKIYFYGVTFKIGTGATSKTLSVGGTDGNQFELENCTLDITSTNNNSRFQSHASTAASNAFIKFNGCVFKFAAAGQGMNLYGNIEFSDCSVSAAGTSPTALVLGSSGTTNVVMHGCDWSHVTGDLFADNGGNGTSRFVLSCCKLGMAPSAAIATQTTVLNRGQLAVMMFDCSNGDEHYTMFHYDPFGTTEVSPTIYANDGAKYDGTNGCSWVITTTANCSYYTPYASPWIDRYHAGTSAITPSLEILRDGSTTAYQDDEVWGEFSYQGTTGSTKATLVNDRMALLGTPANQATGALGAAGWTGEGGSAWFGKINPASTITPAEIGHLRARVVVGEQSITVYVDPTIRVA